MINSKFKSKNSKVKKTMIFVSGYYNSKKEICRMNDISNREDIELLLQKFYEKAFNDEVIGFYFTVIAKSDLEKHLPVISDFWETVLFGVAKYKNNAIAVHNPLHTQHAFEDKHFERWIELFTQTIAENFEGDIAELAKQRANSIATVMKIKIVHGGIGKH